MKSFCVLILCSCTLFLGLYSGCSPVEASPETKLKDISSDSLETILTAVQHATFRYFWDVAEVNSGLARERYHMDDPSVDEHIVTTGGTGFGLMAILVGIERGFVERHEALIRLELMITFLEKAPRFNGVWSHWLDGSTGAVKPFSTKDDAADLVETAFLVQGLLCVRQYFRNGSEREKALATRIDQLWREVNWDFHRGKDRENVLFWHWSPTHGWDMNFRLRGYNETLITYVLAAASPTHSIPAEVYHEGWAESGKILETDAGASLALYHQGDEPLGGPLFWAHYSFVGLNPSELVDQYANYWNHNVDHTRLNYEHCVRNPKRFKGYGPDCWGLTASYSINYYAAHSPKNDIGVISPTASLSSFPYTPKESAEALRNFYGALSDRIYGPYGFYDAFSIEHDWYPKQYLAIDQGPIIVMIENYRSGLIWNLFMSSPEISIALDKLGFKN